MLSLVDIVELIDGVVVRNPGAIVARVTSKPSPAWSLVPVCWAGSGEASSVEFFLTSLDIVTAIVVGERGGGRKCN
jgi:hypothetical protein